MGSITFRRTGNGKGLRLRRVLAIEWEDALPIESEEDITGVDGTVTRAVVFGNLPIENRTINGVEFDTFHVGKKSEIFRATTGTVRPSFGKFFGPPPQKSEEHPYEKLSEQMKAFTSVGIWVPNPNPECQLNMSIFGLEEDVVYEIRLASCDTKNAGPHRICIAPGNCVIVPNAPLAVGQVAVGRFAAPGEKIEIQLQSLDPGRPPSLTSLVLREVDYAPKIFAKIKALNNKLPSQ